MELSERDVCKLANKLASNEERKVIARLADSAREKDQILQERVTDPLALKSMTELAPQNERIEIMNSASEAKKNLNDFCEDLIRRTLDEKVVDNKGQNNGWTNESKSEREEPC